MENMNMKKIIPCLDVRNGKVVKGVKFEDVKDVADPVELAEFYVERGADELVFYDITASVEERTLFTDILKDVADKVTVPFTVGGGISTLEDADRIFKCGADKISINSGAIKNPQLIKEAAERYGSRRIVLSMDIKKADGKFMLFTRGGMENTGQDAVEWAKKCVELGAGELVVNSIDTDGVKGGFDIEMLGAIAEAVSVPIIASGGAGKKEDFAELFKRLPGIDSGLAASIFHFKEVDIRELKVYLNEEGILVNL